MVINPPDVAVYQDDLSSPRFPHGISEDPQQISALHRASRLSWVKVMENHYK